MKKLLCLFMAIAMTLAIGVPAFAVNTESGSTDLTTSIEETFVVTIPGSRRVYKNTGSFNMGDVELTSSRLLPGHQVKVLMTVASNLINQTDMTTELRLRIRDFEGFYISADSPTHDTVVNFVDSDEWLTAPAGYYEGLINFTISSVEVTA